MQRLRGYRVGAILARLSFLLSFAVILSGFPTGAVRADEGPSPAVTTDAKDYRPGDIVTITGFSFLPGEMVTIAVQAPSRPDRFVESVADSSGSFTNTGFSPDEGDLQDFMKIVATGSQSGADRAAIAYFYDSTPAGPCPYVVDASLAASTPLSSKFKTIQEAITALPNPGPCTINIKTGTYTEAVLIDQVNSAAGASSARAVVIQPDASNTGPVIVTAPGAGTNATTSHAFSLQRSNFVTLTGLTISGSARSAIRLIDSVTPKNADITIEGNDIANNNPTGANLVSGVDIGTGQARIWVVNNLIRNNGRMGINVATSTGPIYIVNNTIVGNISGGVARATNSATVSLVNNLIVGNGTASAGAVGTCSCGLSGVSAAALTVKNNMFYANGNGSISSTDIKDAATVLDAGDSNNYVTCTGAGTGCTAASPAIVACTFASCSSTHVASTEIFVGTSDFHLKTTAPRSPAIDRGLGSFQDPASGPDWVPAIDFDGNARPQDGDGVAGSAVDIGFHEAVGALQDTSTSVASSASGNASSYGDLVTFTAAVTSGASPVPAGSGTVSFYDGTTCAGTQIGVAQTVGAGGQASVITSGLSTGGHTITACYSGVVGSLNASNGSVSHTVNKADQTITVTQHAPPTAESATAFTVAASGGASGQPVVVAASGACSASGNTITMTGGTGTCAVTFDQAGSASYNAAAQVTETTAAQKVAQAITVTQHAPSTAAYNTSFTVAATGGASGQPVVVAASGACAAAGNTMTMTSGTGTCTVTFNQAGNASYSAAAQVTETTAAQKAAQTITVTQHAPPTAVYNTSFTVAATGGASAQPVTVGASGVCSAGGNTMTMTSGTGTCTVTFNQAGDANYSAAAQVTETTTAQKAAQAIAVTQHAPSTAVYSTSFTVAATGGGSGQPVTVGVSGVCSASGTTVTMTSGTGTCTVAFNEAGNANYNPAPQVTETTTAQKAAQAITVTLHAPATAVYNTSFTVAAVGGGSGLPVTVGVAGVCSIGGTTATMTSGTGTCTVAFDEAGNANYNPASQVTETTTAQKADQIITFGSLGTKNYGDAAFDVDGTASSTLTVTFGSQTGGTCTVAGKTVTIVHSGLCTVRASQAGNDNYTPAPDVAQSFGINLGPAVLWIGLKNSDDQGTQFDLRVEVYSGATLVASGETRCITGVTRNAALAQQVSVPLTGYATGPASVKILTRIGTTAENLKCAGPGGSHGNAVGLSLYYEATSRPSRVGDAPLYLHMNDIANTTAPVAAVAKQKDSAGVNFLGGNLWKSIGGWQQ